MKRVLLSLSIVVVLYSCGDADASMLAMKRPIKTPKYAIICDHGWYTDITSYTKDSLGCISFHIPEKGGCGCGSSKPAKDVKVCGNYSIEATY